MLEWLRKKKIDCNESMRKAELLSKIKENKPVEKVYVVDKIAESRGHKVVRLPPYNCDLNPIELAWAKIKYNFREHNVTGDMSKERLESLVKSAFLSVTAQDWEGYCKKVHQQEEEYWRRDGIMEIAIDEVVINTAPSSDDDDDFQSNSDESSDL